MGAGLDRVGAASLLSGATLLGQRPSMQESSEDQRSSSQSSAEQSDSHMNSREQFETMVLKTLATFGEKLEFLTAKVNRGDALSGESSKTPQTTGSRGARETDHWMR